MEIEQYSITGLQKILLWLIVIGLVLLATYKLWVPEIIGAHTLYELRNENVNWVPTHEALSQNVFAQGKDYSFKGLSFEVPWTKVIQVKANDQNILAVIFQGNSTDSTSTIVGIVSRPSLREQLIARDPTTQAFFGSQLTTNYAVYNYISNLTLKSVNLFSVSTNFLPKLNLLENKSILIPDWNKPVYSFTTQNNMQGFQFTKSATTTIVDFFTPHDQEYWMFISNATVPEQDSILQSIQESSAAATSSAK